VEERIRVKIYLEDVLVDLGLGEKVYVLHPRTFHVRSLTHGEEHLILHPKDKYFNGTPLGTL
jgi:hypothetical protein